MVDFATLEEDDDFATMDEDAPIARPDDPEEITQYHNIQLMKPESWDQIPAELQLQTALMFEPDRQAQAQIASKQLPEGYTVEWDEESQQAFVRDPEGVVGVINASGPSMKDATEIVGNSLPYLGLNPLTMGSKATATAAGAIETGRQMFSNLQGADTRNENLIPGLDLADVGLATATQAVPDYLTNWATTNKYAPGSQSIDYFNQMIGENLKGLQGGGWMHGLRGQVSEGGPDSRDLKVLREMEHSSPEVRHKFVQQNAEAQAKTDALLETPAGRTDYGAETQGRLQDVRDTLVNERTAAASPLYETAFENTQAYPVQPLIDSIDSSVQRYAPESSAAKTLGSVKRLLGEQPDVDGVRQAPDELQLGQLDSVKRDLDDRIEEAKRAGRNNEARELTGIKENLTGYTDAISNDYKEARSVFAELSRPIEQFDETFAGRLLNLKPHQVDAIGSKVFSPSVSDGMRGDMKVKLDSVDPELFGNLARSEMQARLLKIRDITPEEVPNIPYQIMAAVFPNDKTRTMWKEAMPDQAEQLDDLFSGLRIYSRSRRIGSDTAFNQEARDRLSGSSVNTGADLAKEIIEWLTVIPKATKLGLTGMNRETARRRQSTAWLEQQDPYQSSYLPPGATTKAERESIYPTLQKILALGQGARTEFTEGD